MTETALSTPLDEAWLATDAPGAGDAAMARFWEVFAAAELHLLIDPSSLDGDGTPAPLLFPVEQVETALVFDTASRMAAFMEQGAAHLTLSGRAVIGSTRSGVAVTTSPATSLRPARAGRSPTRT